MGLGNQTVVAVAMGLGLVLAPVAGLAEGLKIIGSTKNRLALFESQSDLIDGKLAKQYSGSVKLTPKYKQGEAGLDEAVPAFRGSYKGEYLEVAKAAALGADLAGLASPFLRAAVESVEAVAEEMTLLLAELRTAMFCAGAADIAGLRAPGVLVRVGGAERDPLLGRLLGPE